MHLRHMLCIGLLGIGFSMTPGVIAPARADDTPSKRAVTGQRRDPLEKYRSLLEKFHLTDAQKPKIDAAFEDAQAKIAEILKHAAAGSDRSTVRGKVIGVVNTLHETVDGILTDEQKDQIKKYQEEHETHAGGDAPKGDAPKGDAPKGDAPKGDAPAK